MERRRDPPRLVLFDRAQCLLDRIVIVRRADAKDAARSKQRARERERAGRVRKMLEHLAHMHRVKGAERARQFFVKKTFHNIEAELAAVGGGRSGRLNADRVPSAFFSVQKKKTGARADIQYAPAALGERGLHGVVAVAVGEVPPRAVLFIFFKIPRLALVELRAR